MEQSTFLLVYRVLFLDYNSETSPLSTPRPCSIKGFLRFNSPKESSLILSSIFQLSSSSILTHLSSQTTLSELSSGINVSKWPYVNICCGLPRANVLAQETLSFHKDAYLFLKAHGKGTHIFSLWFHHTLNQSFMKYI